MVRPILIFVEVLSPHTTGRGRMSMMKSVKIFIRELHRYQALMLMQWSPGMIRFHKYFRGTQIKNPAIIVPT